MCLSLGKKKGKGEGEGGFGGAIANVMDGWFL